jgi:hypothetical protein
VDWPLTAVLTPCLQDLVACSRKRRSSTTEIRPRKKKKHKKTNKQSGKQKPKICRNIRDLE